MFLCTLLFAAMLQPLSCSQPDSLSHLQVGDSIPAGILSAKDSNCQKIAHAAKNTLLLIFFADWCPDCELAMPFVERRLQPVMKSCPNGEIIALGRENNQLEVDKFKAEKGLTFKVLPDQDRKIYECFAEKYIPRFYLFFDSKMVYECEDFYKKDLRNIRKLLKYRKRHVTK